MDRNSFYIFVCDLLNIDSLALSWVNLKNESYMRSAVFILMDDIYGNAGSNELVPFGTIRDCICRFRNDTIALSRASKTTDCCIMYLIEANIADDILDVISDEE